MKMAYNAYDENKKLLPDLDKFNNSGNKFLQSIYDQASGKELSPRQIEIAKDIWEKIQARKSAPPKKWISFTDDQIKNMVILFHYLSISFKAAPRSDEFIHSLAHQLHTKKKLSENQVNALIRKMLKIKRAVMRHIWSGR